MPTASKQKRKPFGTSSRNEGVRLNNSTAPSRPGKENLTQKATSTDAPPRRDSKTPKASNLTTIGGAYGLGDDFLGMNPTRKKVHAKSKQKLMDRRNAAKKKPDPSPVKRPDPAASTTTASASLQKQPKKKSLIKSNVSSALKRNQSDAAKLDESLSDMDTAASSPERSSPLITSPHGKPDPPVRSSEVIVAKKQSQKNTQEHGGHDLVVKKRPAPKFAAVNQNQPVGTIVERGAHPHPRSSTAPLAPVKKRGEEVTGATPAAAAAANEHVLDRSKGRQTDKAKLMEAMMNSCKNKSVVGSVVGGASLERSHSDDMSEMTMMDDNVSTTSMTTLGGDNASKTHAHKKENSSSLRIPSQLNVQRVAPIEDPINTRQANLIDEETIASHITKELKPGGKPQPVNDDSVSRASYLPAGWREVVSKSKNQSFWRHPDLGTTWYYPGIPVPANMQQPSQNNELERSRESEPSEPSRDHRDEDESVANNASTQLTSNDSEVKESATEDQTLQESEKEDGSTTTPFPSKQPDPSPVKKPDPTPTFTASQQSESESKPTSPNTKRISEDYQKLLAPYESIEKSVASKAFSIASRQSKTSFYDDNSSKCLTQEFVVTKDKEEVGDGTPSIGNSVGKMDVDNGSVEFDNTQDDMEGYDEDDIMNDRHTADLNSLSSDHVDVDALLTQRKNASPMSTIRETLSESVLDASPSSSAVSSVHYGNVDSMSHRSNEDDKSQERNSDIDELSLNSDDGINSKSSQDTLSKSAIKDANTAGEEFSDDDLDNNDGGQSPIFESHVDDADDSDDEVEDSNHQSRRKGTSVDGLNLALDLKKESFGRLSDPKRRKFFPLDLCVHFNS